MNTEKAKFYILLSIALPISALVFASGFSLYKVYGTEHFRVFSLLFGALIFTVSSLAIFFMAKAKKIILSLADQLLRHSNLLVGSSDQIILTAKDLAQGSIEQSEGLEQTAAAMHEIDALMKRNRDYAGESKDISSESVNVAHSGKDKIDVMKRSFETIRNGNREVVDSVRESNQKISEITQIIAEISQKTAIINDIVFQTKLLSFNASVEAARAGEHGKGFAVVAEEVGNLANMSGKAANEITAMLDNGIRSVNDIVDQTGRKISTLIDRAQSDIEKAQVSVDECIDVFNSIEDRIRRVDSMVSEISRASDEQARGVEEIGSAINILDQNNQRSTLVSQQAHEVSKAVQEETDGLIKGLKILSDILTFGKKTVRKIEEFVWSSKYKIGVDKMDHEHEILIGKINKLIRSMNKKSVKQIASSFRELYDYTCEHFSDEEEYMRQIQYPNYEAHAKIHQNLLEHLQTYQTQLDKGILNEQKVVAFLQNWLISHIKGIDMKYADFSRQGKQAA
ncbi:hemerythrin-like metal-binding domain protein [Bacteriovorax sp. BSW11_IV]|uniref:bacteriohemerythrin n=1 Tax=Bacteriovorax sp. BSW11_IV TaxID=1353529 RepID=UPI00038A3CF0|nr:bacteriohemerythrin [Bacteriovorax sp. BSW11_IV]EQC48993.1 hemerythrin-like metal-binding domain protein [Bacteriovorax sp. BSW11_IV]